MAGPLDIALLRTFVAVAEAGSLARAAAHVGRSAPAVSMQVARLEARAGGRRLFDRDTRNLALTPAGEALLPRARAVLAAHDAALAALAADALEGRVVAAAPDDYALALLPPVLARFARLHPRAEVEVVCLQTTAVLPKLRAGEVDVAFVTRSDGSATGRGGAPVRREPMVWVGPGPAAAGEGAVWARRPLPVALWEAGSVARAHTVRALEAAGVPHRAAHSSPSLLGLLAVVEAGLAVAALPVCAAPAGLARLGPAEGLPEVAPLDIVLARGAGSASAAADAFAAIARDALAGGSPR